tara:strand:+ start:4092 stop:5180 length:1089 start_codon:yes stop_codon:yes gene_type:complete
MALVPPYIKKLSPYVPGKPIEEAKRETGQNNFIKLASNENPFGPSPLALKSIQNSINNLNRYPDASGFYLRKKLANKQNIKIENVVLGAGSEGILSTIMRTFLLEKDEIITAKNSFIGFQILAKASGKKTHWVTMKNHKYDLVKMAEKINSKTKIIYIANPDNPMGTYITKEEFNNFYRHVPERVLIILDEAYYEFAQKLDDFPDSMLYRYDNVITLRTFSKAYGLAGLRLGYGFARKQLIENLMKVKAPFEPSIISQIAGNAALDDNTFLKKTLKSNEKEMDFLTSELNKLQIKNIRSATNFLTTKWTSEKQANKVANFLFDNGIIIRKLNSFGWKEYLRISIGNHIENKKLIKSLKKFYD